MNSKRVRGILLDLDGTLYDYEKCNEFAKEKAFVFLSRELGKPKSTVRKSFNLARRIVHRDLKGTAASHSRLLYFQKTIEILTGKTNPELILKVHALFWREFFRKMKLYPWVVPFFQSARKKGVKIAIVSDMTAEIQLRKIARLRISSYIDFVVTSEETGREKPSPKVFRQALKKINVSRRNSIIVGDDKAKDGIGGKKIGIDMVIVRAPNSNSFGFLPHA